MTRRGSKETSVFHGKRDWIFVAGAVLLGVAFRLFLMRYRFAVNFDEVNYLKLGAGGALHGLSEVLHPYWPPLYSFVIALFSRIVPDFEWAGRLVSILCGSFLLVPVFLFTRHRFGRRTAFIAVLWLAFYPSLAFLNTSILTESLYTLLISAGVFTGWFALSRRSWILGFVVGSLFGLAYLTRAEGIGFLVVFAGLSAVIAIVSVLQERRARMLLVVLASILGFASVSARYVVYLHEITGKWTMSAKGRSLQEGEAIVFAGMDSDTEIWRRLSEDNRHVLMDRVFHSREFYRGSGGQGESVIEITPALLLKKYTTNLYRVLKYGVPQALGFTVFLLLVLGLLGEAWSKERTVRELYLIAYFGFYWFLLIPLFHINMRYFLPLMPIGLIWAAHGSERLASWLEATLLENLRLPKKIGHRRIARWGVLLFIAGTVFLPELGRVMKRNRWSDDYFADPVGQRKAGLWLKEHAPASPVIMSRNHAVDVYAGNYDIVESVTIPQEDLDRVLAYAEYRGVDYFVLDERYIRDYPRLAHLLEETGIPRNLRLIYKDRDASGLRTMIFEIVRE